MALTAGEYISGGEVRDADGRTVVIVEGGGASGIMNYQTFTSGGTFTVPAGVTRLRIRAVGAGGGGGGGGSAAAAQLQVGGGGGGGGHIIEQVCPVVAGDTITVTIGTGGAGAAGGAAAGNSRQ